MVSTFIINSLIHIRIAEADMEYEEGSDDKTVEEGEKEYDEGPVYKKLKF